MAAGDTHVADPLDTVHHEMNTMDRSHLVYNSVCLPVKGEQVALEKETAS